jgi:G3E family GTPase
VNLIALTGLGADAKARFALALLARLQSEGKQIAVIDNNDKPLIFLDPHYQQGLVGSTRLSAGCVCCALAPDLIAAVHKYVRATPAPDVLLMPVSALAEADALAVVLASLAQPALSITTIALIDDRTRQRFPHLAERLAANAQQVVDPADLGQYL